MANSWPAAIRFSRNQRAAQASGGMPRCLTDFPHHRNRHPARKSVTSSCPNCGTPVADRFCPGCGQRNADRLVSLRAFLRDVLEDQLSLEGRLPRTLAALLGRPGKLTAEYAAGRVARYVPPFRLYLVSGLLFFVTVSWVASFDRLWAAATPYTDEVTGAALDGADVVIVNIPLDTLAAPRPLQPMARSYVRQQARLNALPPREAARILYGGTIGSVSGAVLLLVPAFALLLKMLYRRRLYIEHIVFILHLHAGLFLLALPPLILPTAWIAIPAAVWMVAYAFLALLRVYGQSVVRTGAKSFILLLMYNLAIVLLFIAVMVFAVLTF
jgi:hypothetical protein